MAGCMLLGLTQRYCLETFGSIATYAGQVLQSSLLLGKKDETCSVKSSGA
jgi:hypothetical protein